MSLLKYESKFSSQSRAAAEGSLDVENFRFAWKPGQNNESIIYVETFMYVLNYLRNIPGDVSVCVFSIFKWYAL